MRMRNGEERLPCYSEPKGRFDPDRPHKKEWRTSMEIECLTPEFPQGARVYSSDGIAPTLLNSASAMRSQSILIRGGSAAYTMKIRGGCEGGGKGALVQEELSATLATHQDQTLFESHGCFPINTMLATRYKALGRGTGLGIGNDGDPQYTITKGHEHAVAYSVGDVPDTAFANAGDTVARTLTARADGSPMIDRGPNIVTQKGK